MPASTYDRVTSRPPHAARPSRDGHPPAAAAPPAYAHAPVFHQWPRANPHSRSTERAAQSQVRRPSPPCAAPHVTLFPAAPVGERRRVGTPLTTPLRTHMRACHTRTAAPAAPRCRHRISAAEACSCRSSRRALSPLPYLSLMLAIPRGPTRQPLSKHTRRVPGPPPRCCLPSTPAAPLRSRPRARQPARPRARRAPKRDDGGGARETRAVPLPPQLPSPFPPALNGRRRRRCQPFTPPFTHMPGI